jgi:hypothetical protein
MSRFVKVRTKDELDKLINTITKNKTKLKKQVDDEVVGKEFAKQGAAEQQSPVLAGLKDVVNKIDSVLTEPSTDPNEIDSKGKPKQINLLVKFLKDNKSFTAELKQALVDNRIELQNQLQEMLNNDANANSLVAKLSKLSEATNTEIYDVWNAVNTVSQTISLTEQRSSQLLFDNLEETKKLFALLGMKASAGPQSLPQPPPGSPGTPTPVTPAATPVIPPVAQRVPLQAITTPAVPRTQPRTLGTTPAPGSSFHAPTRQRVAAPVGPTSSPYKSSSSSSSSSTTTTTSTGPTTSTFTTRTTQTNPSTISSTLVDPNAQLPPNVNNLSIQQQSALQQQQQAQQLATPGPTTQLPPNVNNLSIQQQSALQQQQAQQLRTPESPADTDRSVDEISDILEENFGNTLKFTEAVTALNLSEKKKFIANVLPVFDFRKYDALTAKLLSVVPQEKYATMYKALGTYLNNIINKIAGHVHHRTNTPGYTETDEDFLEDIYSVGAEQHFSQLEKFIQDELQTNPGEKSLNDLSDEFSKGGLNAAQSFSIPEKIKFIKDKLSHKRAILDTVSNLFDTLEISNYSDPTFSGERKKIMNDKMNNYLNSILSDYSTFTSSIKTVGSTNDFSNNFDKKFGGKNLDNFVAKMITLMTSPSSPQTSPKPQASPQQPSPKQPSPQQPSPTQPSPEELSQLESRKTFYKNVSNIERMVKTQPNGLKNELKMLGVKPVENAQYVQNVYNAITAALKNMKPATMDKKIADYYTKNKIKPPDFGGQKGTGFRCKPNFVSGWASGDDPYKVTGSGNFGKLKIDIPLLKQKFLRVYKDGKQIAYQPAPPDLENILTKRYMKSNNYSPETLSLFQKLTNHAELPMYIHSPKYRDILSSVFPKPDPKPEPTPVQAQTGGCMCNKNHGNDSVMIFGSVDEVIERLHILLGEMQAGNDNTKIQNEISKLLDWLKKNDHLQDEDSKIIMKASGLI